MGTEKQTFTGDSSQLQKEYDALAKRAEKLEEKLNKATKTSADGTAKLSKEMKELGKFAEQTGKAVATPLEQYEQKLAKLKAALDKGKLSQEQYNRAVVHAKQALHGAGSTQDSLFFSGLQNLTAMAAGWVSVTGAIQAATQAHKEKLKLEREAADKQLSLAASQEQVLLNLSGVSSDDKRKFLADVGGVQDRTGFKDLGALYRAAAGGVSASAGDRTGTLSALEASAALARNNPESLSTFVGGALDIRRASGLDDARQNLEFLMSTGAQARIERPELLARNVAPAVSSIVATDRGKDRVAATRDAGALFAALSMGGTDTTGESTRTAATAFAVNLEEFFTEGISEGTGKKKRVIKPGTDPGTVAGRIEALQRDAKMREAFLSEDKYKGEKRYQIPYREILQGGQVADDFRSARSKIDFSGDKYAQLARELGGLTNPLALAAAAGKSEGNIEQHVAGSNIEARRAEVRKILAETARQTAGGGAYGLATRMGNAAFEGMGLGDPILEKDLKKFAPEEAGLRRLDKLWNELVAREKNFGLSEEDKKSFALIERQTKVLEEMLASMKSQEANANGNHAAANAERGGHKEK